MPSSSIGSYLRRALAQTGSQRALAEALDMGEENISRLMKGANPGVDACLLLADLIDEAPGDVLRAANKGRTAEIHEQIYGTENDRLVRLSAADLASYRLWRTLPASDRAHIRAIVRRLSQAADDSE